MDGWMITMLGSLSLWPYHLLYKWPLFLPQDTTDYVAYVAKDPVNRRGKQYLPHLITHLCESWRNAANQMFLIISVPLANHVT